MPAHDIEPNRPPRRPLSPKARFYMAVGAAGVATFAITLAAPPVGGPLLAATAVAGLLVSSKKE
ncbi:hypothetical protein [Kitasatospora sp. NPDC089509]|uniref:hypothetical protein n=1 Tax=Kitasatospora sp. NPDC089509 TaxID=3364079 RepID=UPI00382639E3